MTMAAGALAAIRGAARLTIAGISTRYVVAAIAVLLVVAVAAILLAHRRPPALHLRRLDAAEARRYAEAFATAERDFEARPEVAIGQAKGIVEEVLRRMGFPDRVDAAQKARDLAGHDRAAAAALEAADRALRQGPGSESLQRALGGYRAVLDRLLPVDDGS